ncbi:MAG TPA: DNA primase [candidate division Zixibacteria bacterium]|nr:DNA primase [candidate division Zixibacteria bacterium]
MPAPPEPRRAATSNPGDFAYTVKQQADIVRIVGEYVQLRRSGAQNFQGLCPFHNEKSPSFSVHATRQFFHCFGCGVSGDVFSFVQKIENITFPEAVRLVAQKLGIPLPKVQFSSPEEAREAKMRGALLDLNESACQFFQQQLMKPEAAHAREYLKGRGLDAEAIKLFRIGFAPESGFLLRDRLKNEASEELLRESGLFSWKDRGDSPDEAAKANTAALYSKFRNRIMFPICNEQGKVIAFTGRTLATDEKSGPKYLNSPETPIYSKSRVLFNLHLAKEAIRQLGYMILVEGQMDCISVYNAGFHNVIASSGTAFTEMQAKLLGRYCKNIVVNFDPDTAGAAATERSLAMLVTEDFQIRILSLEQGFDPDLYIRRKGKEAYETALRGAQRYFDYIVERAQKQFPVRTPEGKAKAVGYLLPHIQRVPNRIVRDELATDIAQKLQVDPGVLRLELRHSGGQKTIATRPHLPLRPTVSEAERVLLRALAGGEMVTAPDESGNEVTYAAADQAHYSLTSEHLHEGLPTEALLNKLLAAWEAKQDPLEADLTEQERGLLHTVLLRDAEPLSADLLHNTLESLRIPRWERRQAELRRELAKAAGNGDNDAVRALMTELRDVDLHLRTLRGVV